jgi:ribonuclease HI
MFYDGS